MAKEVNDLGGDSSNADIRRSDQGEAFVPDPLKEVAVFQQTFEFGERVDKAVNASRQGKVGQEGRYPMWYPLQSCCRPPTIPLPVVTFNWTAGFDTWYSENPWGRLGARNKKGMPYEGDPGCLRQ